ncbi:hypothetical protein EDB82DRAFT_438863 [Fusarium venenatum]|uniref:uncharacterized protein n=1 Tax=Fusarium venenatum TaxID=56646 RepID=UPI001D1B3220|nr:hypothetical protein EDB82DRAFT_438863 [Fusarium venenatum]
MLSLIDLPSELQLPIFNSLSAYDLSSLSKINKSFRRAAEPILYSRIKLKWDKSNTQTPSIVPFLRTIMDRPELGGLVNHLFLQGDDSHGKPDYWNSRLPLISITGLQTDQASHMIRQTKILEAHLWIQALLAGNMDAVVAILFTKLPNLKLVHFEENWTIFNPYLGMVLRGALCEPSKHRLPNYKDLTEVNISAQSGQYRLMAYQNTQDVLPLFYLPKLHSLSIAVDSPEKFEWPSSAPPVTSVRYLNLYRLREIRLRPLLSALKNIETLKWDLWYQQDLDKAVSKPIVQLDELASALCLMSSTLRDLTITGDSCPAFSYGDYDPPPLYFEGSLDNMTNLHNLRRLEIPWVLLMGSFSPKSTSKRLRDGVPVGVEVLILNYDLCVNYDQMDWEDDDFIAVIEGELEHRQLVSTSLRCITLDLWGPEQLPAVKDRERLELKAAQANIKLVWYK